MSKSIKEPISILLNSHPVAKCNTIPVNLQQIKEPYERNNYKCNNLIGTLPIHNGRDPITNTCKRPICCGEDKLLLRNSSQNKELLVCCAPNTTTVNNTVTTYCTTTTAINTTTTNDNQMVQEHGEDSGTDHYYDAVTNGGLDVSCSHTFINEALSTTRDISNATMITTVFPLSVSSPEHASKNDIKQFGMEILYFINILLCMLMRHLMCKDMFSSMFMVQRASKGSVASQSEAIAMFDSKSLLCCNILSSYTDSWNKILTFCDYLLDKVILCCTLILSVVNSHVDCISCQVISCDVGEYIHHIKELPQTIIRISRCFHCSTVILSLTVTGLSLWWLNVFELSNIKNFGKGLTIEEHSSHSMFNNITLHDDKVDSDHCNAITAFSITCTNCSANITLSRPSLTNDYGKLTNRKKIFKDYAISKSCFALEWTHWCFLLNTTSSLNYYKYYSAQFRNHPQQNVYDNSLLAITKVVNNCCDDSSSVWCVTNCSNTWLSTREIIIPLYDSPCVSERHKVQSLPIDHCMLSLAVTIIDAFVILCVLSLIWRSRLFYNLVMMLCNFCSTAKPLIVNVIASYCRNLTRIKSFKSIQHRCDDGMWCTQRIQTLNPINSSCTVSKPLPHNISEMLHNTAYNDSLHAYAAIANDEVLSYREEAGDDQSYWTLEDVHENVLCVFETCEHNSVQNEDEAELVIGTTGWTKSNYCNTTASHDASPDSCDGDNDDIPVCIPSSDNSSHEVVSVYAGLHYQLAAAGCRNADHTFVQDEKNVEGNPFSFSSPLGNTYETNISSEIFRRSCYIDESVSAQDIVSNPHVNTEIDVIEATPIEEEYNYSDQGGNHMKGQPEDAKGIEKGDDDSDDSDHHNECEECYSVEECQPCDATSNEVNGTAKLSNVLDDGVQCCSDDSGEFLIGIYTINKAYGADHNILSVNGQVLHVHTFNDIVRPIVGDHGSKPKASNNQPPAFEYTAYNNRLTVNQSQEAASLATAAAAGLPYATRTEHNEHQQITSTFDDDTFVEKDGRLRDDRGDDHLITPEEQRYTTKDPEQIQRIGPDYSETKFRDDAPLPYEEVKQNSKAKTTFLQHEVEDRSLKQNIVQNDHSVLPQVNTASNTTSSKPKSLSRRSCIVAGDTRYPLTPYLLAHPHMDHFFVKERKEIKPGHFLAKLVLQHHYLIMQNSNTEVNDTVTAAQQSQAAAIIADSVTEERDGAITKRQHFAMNVNRTGYIVFSSDLTRFTGDIKYPLPGRKATAVKLGKGGNGFVFSIFHNGKEYAVKKTVYRANEIRVHSQLAHVNLVNLEAVLIGEEHDHHKGKFYAFYFMNKLDMDFRSVISTKEHGCLKHLKLQLSEQRNVWEVVMVNVKYVLRSVLRALDYMHSQGLVHRDVKASNILLKMKCQCTKPLMCACPQKYAVKLGDFDSSTTVPGHGLNIEPHQLIRYASVLPLGTMGYRAPEVSMHLVISGPYEVLYTTAVDIWSFGCLLMNIMIGKCGPLKQRGEASLLLSVQDQPYSEDLYNKIIKMKELQKYYSDIPEMVDLVRKCLQVKVHCRPTAKQLLQLDILQC